MLAQFADDSVREITLSDFIQFVASIEERLNKLEKSIDNVLDEARKTKGVKE